MIDISGMFRLLLALCIVVFHTKSFYDNELFKSPIFDNPFFFNGVIVNLFFFSLSGYGMYLKYNERIKNNKVKWIDYFWGRYAKLMSLSLLTLPAGVLFQHLYYGKNGVVAGGGMSTEPTILRTISDALLITTGCGIQDGNPYNQPLWYIDVLLIMYVINYFLAKSKHESLLRVLGILCCASLMHGGVTVWRFDSRIFSSLFAFLCGQIVAKYENKKTNQHKILISSLAILSLFILYSYIFRKEIGEIYSIGDQMLLVELLMWIPLLIICTSIKVRPESIIGRCSTFMGKLATSVYIWHYPFIYFSCILIYKLFKIPSSQQEHFEVQLILLGMVSIISCLLLEKWSFKITKRIINWFSDNI